MLQILQVTGIPVRVDVSWLLIFALISWSLASGYVPHVLPDLTRGAAWLHAVAAALLLFVSVFLHELSHALVARRQGVRVAGIRLHVFGGVSEMESEPPTPRAEFLIAAVGPLTSLVIAAICYGLGRVVGGTAWAAALTGYLAAVNAIVALFNLVPGFPLDGGRLLRAMLWSWSGHLAWATRWAARVGSLFAFALIALGVVRAGGGELVGGLWFILVGLFLHRAARASDDMLRTHHRLEALRVADVMTPHALGMDALPVSLGPDDVVAPQSSAWTAFLKTGRNRAGLVAVVDDGRLVGSLSHDDLQRAAALEHLRADAGRRAA